MTEDISNLSYFGLYRYTLILIGLNKQYLR